MQNPSHVASVMTLLNCKIRVFQGRLILWFKDLSKDPGALRFSALLLTLLTASEDDCGGCNFGFLFSASHRAVYLLLQRSLCPTILREDAGSHSDWPSLRHLFMDQELTGERREDADCLSLSGSDLVGTGDISVPLQYMVGVKKG